MRKLPLFILGIVLFAGAIALMRFCCTPGIEPGPGFRKSLQEALIKAKPGDVLDIPEGTHDIDLPLSLAVDNVTLRGKGMDKTVLSFRKQTTGPAGLMVTANGFTIEDLAFEDTKGDGIKVKGGDKIVIRRFRAEWTGGPKETNGAYGIYPVECKNVLIEDSIVKGASDAGIYVGQSTNIVVRRNHAELNVAGIEIENSVSADVYENTATNNTGGILVFNLPDLPMKGGRLTRVYNNRIIANNTPNFAPKGNIVAKVPAGTGLMILATRDIEIFKNTINDNASTGVSIISYLSTGNPLKDAAYDPFTESIHIHDNMISGGGAKPDGAVQLIAKAAGTPVPAVIYDGIFDPKKLAANKVPDELRICVRNNTDMSFLNYNAADQMKKPSRDAKPHDCALPPLPAVTLPFGS